MERTDPQRLIAVGASAGGVEALRRLVAGLPADLPAAVVVVLHLPAEGKSVLPAILNRAGSLPATAVEARESLEPRHIYVAPADQHVIVGQGELALARGPRENGYRPAVDMLFRTAAVAYGPRTVGVVLSGALDDGAAGLAVIKDRGGAAVVQDPADASYPGMPEAALARVEVDHVAPVGEIAALLTELPVALDVETNRENPGS